MTPEEIKQLDRIRRQVKSDISYGGAFFDLKFLLNLYDRETERLKRQDNDVIISYAIEVQQLKSEIKRLRNGKCRRRRGR